MSSIQKPKYFMGLQHGEGQSPQALFANVLMIPRGLELFHMPSALCTRPNLQSAAPTENCPREAFSSQTLLSTCIFYFLQLKWFVPV